MTIPQRVADSNVRLLTRFADAKERRGPHYPNAAELIHRVVRDASLTPTKVDDDDIRAALALVAVDRQDAEMRETNVIEHARRRGLSWRDIAWSLGLDSAQAAQKRFDRLTSPPEILVYAFRVAGETEWHGKPDLLETGYESGSLYFDPARPSPFGRRTLELRYGPVDEAYPASHMRAYAPVNNRRVPLTTAVQVELFGG